MTEHAGEDRFLADHLIRPHGGVLVNLMVEQERAHELVGQSTEWPSWTLSPHQLCDLELLLAGGFSPLRGFLGRRDYLSVCSSLRLTDGTLWPVPVTLDVPDRVANGLQDGGSIALRDPEGVMLAALHVDDIFRPDSSAAAEAVSIGTEARPWCLEGRLEGLQLPGHCDFRSLRRTPAELRTEFTRLGWQRVISFVTQDPMHRAHQALTLRAAEQAEANVLIHAAVGMARRDDLHHYTRVRCHHAMISEYPPGLALLSLLPLALGTGGPREALLQAIVEKNHGASHVILGNLEGADTAAGVAQGGTLHDREELVRQHEAELGVTVVPFRRMVYVQELDTYLPDDEVPPGVTTLSLSPTEQRRRLNEGVSLPGWFTPQRVAEELQRSHRPRSEQGFTVFFTGLSGSGKSTIANMLLVQLLELGGRPVTLLDGDIVRQHLSSELGFSKEHRNVNVRRIGYVASEITKHGGVAICAPIAPYDVIRREVRSMVEEHGGFVLVHVATPLEVCEQRDRKGLYAKARAGQINSFTGVSDPYEEPTDADAVLDTAATAPEEAAHQVVRYLVRQGYLASSSAVRTGMAP